MRRDQVNDVTSLVTSRVREELGLEGQLTQFRIL